MNNPREKIWPRTWPWIIVAFSPIMIPVVNAAHSIFEAVQLLRWYRRKMNSMNTGDEYQSENEMSWSVDQVEKSAREVITDNVQET